MSSDNVSDALRKRAGTDFADFSDERLDRMFTSGLMARGSRSSGPQRPTNGNAQRGRGQDGRQKRIKELGNALLYGEQSDDFFKSLTDWSDAADAAGIKRVDSDKDVAEIRKKVNDEYQKRMISAGVSGLAKAEDISAPATNVNTVRKAKADDQEFLDNYSLDVPSAEMYPNNPNEIKEERNKRMFGAY